MISLRKMCQLILTISSDLGYEEIKQEILDSGKVIYHRRITQIGREFILNLLQSEVA